MASSTRTGVVFGTRHVVDELRHGCCTWIRPVGRTAMMPLLLPPPSIFGQPTACRRIAAVLIAGVMLCARSASAQSDPSWIAPASLDAPSTSGATGLLARAETPLFGVQNPPLVVCSGCPPRRLGTAILQATYINVFYGLANLIRGQDTAKITPRRGG